MREGTHGWNLGAASGTGSNPQQRASKKVEPLAFKPQGAGFCQQPE